MMQLAQMQAEALFVHDANGKLLRINEPDNLTPAPRFFLTRTRTANLWRTRYDLPADLAHALEQLAAAEPISADLPQLPLYTAEYVELLQPHSPADAGPAYYLPESDQPSQAVLITPENVSVLQTHFDWLRTTLADYAPVAATVVDGQAVAVCFCSRITTQVAEAGVYTATSYRGHGYATDAVRGWATAVRASGRLPLYDTSWTNNASQAIAQKLGAVQYGANYSLT